VTITGYAHSNPNLARSRAVSATNYLRARVNVSWSWKVVWISNRALNRVTVTTTAL
jgi:hypothetical protein